MSKSSTKSAPIPNTLLACAATGLLMGQLVMGISAHHEGSVMGLVLAVVFVLCGGASLALFLSHRHASLRPRTERAPLPTWVATLGAALIASIWFGRFL